MAIDTALRDPSAEDDAMRAFHAARDRASRSLYEISRDLAAYEWGAKDLLDLQARFVAEVVEEAKDAARLLAWAGVPSPQPVGRRVA
jgi:hypothetical protein